MNVRCETMYDYCIARKLKQFSLPCVRSSKFCKRRKFVRVGTVLFSCTLVQSAVGTVRYCLVAPWYSLQWVRYCLVAPWYSLKWVRYGTV